MPKEQSINQNLHSDVLPNFRNTGVALRVLLLVNGMALLVALAEASSWGDITQHMFVFSALLQPVLLVCLLFLFILNSVLTRLSYRWGVAAVILLTVIITNGVYYLGGDLFEPFSENILFPTLRNTLLGSAISALMLGYFRLRTRSLSPALHDSRLQALQARIRPHFLFNSINAVLGILRSNPKRAETALEDMSDLFRMAMAYSSNLVSICQEVALARQYLALEQLRLGERLLVDWHMEDMPEDALLPPLILQPLLENAVYHGIEPLTEGGVIDIRLYRSGKELHLEMDNPCQKLRNDHIGNKMALSNIRERLALQFDIEASYSVESGNDFYHVHIILPYVKEEKNDHC